MSDQLVPLDVELVESFAPFLFLSPLVPGDCHLITPNRMLVINGLIWHRVIDRPVQNLLTSCSSCRVHTRALAGIIRPLRPPSPNQSVSRSLNRRDYTVIGTADAHWCPGPAVLRLAGRDAVKMRRRRCVVAESHGSIAHLAD